ncbi:uncharacterized protein A4U43_C04F34960 [Asparagus officinalis]|uniref:Protein kinase domain-containing protein n=1 Tax=Asparagus officinalis TaxID=4686 RepID=A0A5P1F8N4_ASPOF|nr:probable leucine-rich repeat receptor-like protein kinase At1g68400 [Asparagus officinalis]ONK73757.1 uncharacterized protein A4U43_C04F34960 [Asparagus officinalis]
MDLFSKLFIFLLFSSSKPIHASGFYRLEREDLLYVRDSLTSTANLHSKWTGPPCFENQTRWIGITCFNSHVVGINLTGIQLTGSLPPKSLQHVAYLENLNLSDNALHGDIPTLQGLNKLKIVSLARNKFSGSIPEGFMALPRLTRLELQDNLLNGKIPSFDQKSLTEFNVSYNFLEGKIPETSVLQRFKASSFDHNLRLCGRPLNKPCRGLSPSPSPSPSIVPPSIMPSPTSGPSRTKKLENWVLIVIGVCGVMALAMIVLCCLCYYKRNRKKETMKKREVSGETSSEFPVSRPGGSLSGEGTSKLESLEFFDKSRQLFNLDELLRSSAEVIGKSKLGTTYRTTLEQGNIVVVKRLRGVSGLSRKDFVQQMEILGALRHENLVEIIAFYYSKDEKLVVYEHVGDGSLSHLLHDNRGVGRLPLNWSSRLKIAKGIAKALAYLHHSLPSHRVPHSNLKTSSILIHDRRHPKLTDFGLLPLFPSPHLAQDLAIRSSPEFSQGKKLNHKTDIYCFGLVLLEIITGQVPEDHDGDLPSWVRSAISCDWSTDVLDLEIVAEKERHGDMLMLVDIALQCAAVEPGRRPSVSVLVERIEEISEGEG